MASREPPQLLSYSFLDILACTVAAVLFVLMVMALRLAEVSPASLPQAELFALQAQRAQLDEALKGPSPEDRALELETLRARVEALTRQVQARTREAKAAERAADRRERTLARARNPRGRTIAPRPTRATEKRVGISFDVYGDRVDVVDVRGSEPSGTPAQVTVTLGLRARIAAAEVSGVQGRLAEILDRVNPAKHYAFAFLRPHGIPTFLRLRKALSERGIDLDWQPNLLAGTTFRVPAPEARKPRQGPRTD